MPGRPLLSVMSAAVVLTVAGGAAFAGGTSVAARASAAGRGIDAGADTLVYGQVLTADGQALAGAAVMARPTPGTRAAEVPAVRTDADGRFRLTGLARGTYWFVAIHGAHPLTVTTPMPLDRSLFVRIVLDGPMGRA
ncbi:MAG: carboxypeptidase regulatory-like domain-containing protein [Kofleriaceae bacterium]|nr:carboxypeptidase regulatory-like domain-containing protein [Kofleriaceae bacterium]